ncbi:MAG: hypothetical protein Q8K61_09970 [Gallionella sp.]|nr:hypothetical protein [Gallionella sp.]
MPIKILLIATFVLTLTGCASLPAVQKYSVQTRALADSIDVLAQDSSASCFRRLALDVPVKGLSNDTRLSYAADCDQLKLAGNHFIQFNGITRAYGELLGQLADNQRLFPDEASAKNALANFNTAAPYFNAAQLNAVSALANLLLRASTDAYRRNEIKQVLDRHDDIVQLASLLSAFINHGYLPVLANESGNLDGLEELLNDRYIKTEPLRARELIESIKQQKINLAYRQKSAKAVLIAIDAMVDVHAALLNNTDNDKLLIELLQDYAGKIHQVRSQILSAF